jgi:hypothetical protein
MNLSDAEAESVLQTDRSYMLIVKKALIYDL